MPTRNGVHVPETRKMVQVIPTPQLKRAFKGIRTRRTVQRLLPGFVSSETQTRIAMGKYGREENARQMEERHIAETTRRQKTVRIEDLK